MTKSSPLPVHLPQRLCILLMVTLFLVASSAEAQPSPRTAALAVRRPAVTELLTLHITRIPGGIEIDGALDEPVWQQAVRVDTWYETNPGDNTEPKVRSIGYLAYDEAFLYAGFEFDDPRPEDIRAPIRDRDNFPNQDDYGGLIIDPSNTGRSAIEMLANPYGVQFDGTYDDSTGIEDASPDFFWDAAARIHDHGWSLELRIPFSSLSYPHEDPKTWRIMLFRNYPRDFRYQFFTARLPRGRNCLICRSNVLSGLERLPAGGGIVLAPYASGSYEAAPGGALGSRLNGAFDATGGFDASWRPDAGNVIKVTVNPDFSQIESDVAQITANERFALSYPEKRPFFTEGSDLFATPIRAVYTRTITDPLWGARGTGRLGNLSYTALAAQDEGGGSVIIPHSNFSEQVAQDFRSWAGIGRLRYEIGRSFAGLLATSREAGGGVHNRVVGPDFGWRLGDGDSIVGQVLGSWTRTPERMAVSPEWDGRVRSGYAARLQWRHSSLHFDWSASYQEISDHFRADDGYVRQAGFREGSGEIGYTFHPESGPLSRIHPYAAVDRSIALGGNLLFQDLSIAVDADGLLSSFTRIAYTADRVLAGTKVLPRQQLTYSIGVSPSIIFSRIDLSGTVGQQVDFDNARTGTGADISLGLTVQPTSHLELLMNESLRWLDVRSDGERQRLFTARVDRLRVSYSFSSRLSVHVIGQYQVTRRTPELYLSEVKLRDSSFNGSALFSLRLNWQSVLLLGYGDARVFSDITNRLEPQSRQLFVKISYAFQY